MGRRSINTTKSGKFMNPTDQARKEARKKELKKNKKQRQLVRAAVLKGKDPIQLIEEMEKIDQMEYNVLQPSPLNEKVLKEKRRKLKETLDRVLKMYNKDDPEKWVELRRARIEYEKRRAQLIQFYDSVKHAQQVQVDDIPLPAFPNEQSSYPIHFPPLTAQIPLPSEFNVPLPPPMIIQPVGILKKTPSGIDKKPPGVPSGPPPDLSEYEDDDDEQIEPPTINLQQKSIRFADDIDTPTEKDQDTDNTEKKETSAPKPTSLQQKMLALSGQNIDDFMKEMENVHKKRELELSSKLSAMDKRLNDEIPPGTEAEQGDVVPPGTETQQTENTTENVTVLPPVIFQPPPTIRPPSLMAVRLPPGPPGGGGMHGVRPNLPPGPPPGLPPRLGIRLPPGPPPGMPPRMLRMPGLPPRPPLPPNAPLNAQATPNVVSAGPQLINRADGVKGATIMAKPQIRNLSADVTRFVPSALRVKREDKKPKGISRAMVNEFKMQEVINPTKGSSINQPTKDDAYMQFMKEMEGLL